MAKSGSGIQGFYDYKFWLSLTLYATAALFFFEVGQTWDSFYIVMPALISLIVVSTLAWDYRIIGNPANPFCLVLHLAFFATLVFLLNRLLLMGDFNLPLLGAPVVSGLPSSLLKNLPLVGDLYNLFNVALKSLGFALVLTLVAFAIIFKPRTAEALLVISGCLLVAVSVGRNMSAGLWSLFGGIAMLVVAFWLQLEDENKNRFWNKVADRLRNSVPRPRLDLRLQIAILRRLNERESLTEQEIRGIAAGLLGCDSGDPRLRDVCIRLLDQLVAQEGIAEARDGNQGKRLVLAIPDDPPDIFANAARVLRGVIVTGFTVLYILSPIDIIPDATPVFGVVDDMVIGAVGFLSTMRTFQGRSRMVDKSLDRLPFNP